MRQVFTAVLMFAMMVRLAVLGNTKSQAVNTTAETSICFE